MNKPTAKTKRRNDFIAIGMVFYFIGLAVYAYSVTLGAAHHCEVGR
jgi:hypothetical protein